MEAPAKSVNADRPKGWDLVPTNEALRRKIISGSRWLYWIAGLSAVNALMVHFHAPVRFSIGLGITELVYGVGLHFGSATTIVAIALDAIILAAIAALGYFGTRFRSWALVSGILVVALDILLLVVLTGFTMFMSIIFHGLAAMYLVAAFQALKLFKKRQADGNA